MTMTYPNLDSRSAALYQRAREVLAGGNTRHTIFFPPYPVYAVSGSGSKVVDADGVERVDCINNYMTLIHGHAHPEIVEAVTEQVRRGSCFAMPTELEIELAEIITERVESVETMRFCNSGSEAVLVAIKAARAYTDRPMIAKCEGAYHGCYDPVEVSLSSAPGNWGDPDEPARVPFNVGTPERVMEDVLVLPYNEVEASRKLIERHADRLAAILVDPVPARIGCVPMRTEYAQMVREVATRHGIVLICDEVASFRVRYHGSQSLVGMTPDLTTFGKIIGGGLPVGAVGGSREVMSVFDGSKGTPRAPHAGTFNANPPTMAGGIASMRLLSEDALEVLNARGDRARERINAAFEAAGVAGQAIGAGSLVMVHFNRRDLDNHRDVLPTENESRRISALHKALLNRGFMLGAGGLAAISTVNTDQEIDDLADAIEDSLREMRLNDPGD